VNSDNLTSLRRTAFAGIIIAMAIALGYALASVPNIEMVTFTLALGGAVLGYSRGAVVGAMGFALYSALSPYGIAPPPLFIAQTLGGAAIGIGGAGLGAIFHRIKSPPIRVACSAGIGLLVTLLYDILTNIGSFIVASTKDTLGAFIIGGLAFSLVHIVWNGAIFAMLFPAIFRVAGRSIFSLRPKPRRKAFQ